MISRRTFVALAPAIGAAGVLRARLAAAAPAARAPAGPRRPAQPPGLPGRDYTPVVTPNGSSLPFRIVGGTKVFHLVAHPLRVEMAPGLELDCWGYNGNTPGPTLEAVEGEPLRIFVTNRLPEPTSIHWHGMLVPNGMDGIAGLTQPAIPVGQTFVYEFLAPPPASYMYHPHFDEMVQMGLGLMGMFVVHPRGARARVDRDYALLLSEWFVRAGAKRPDPLEMTDFNVFTINSRVFPATQPLVAQLGERVRIRIGNLSAMDHHPIHLHGFRFHVTGTDGGPIPPSAQWPETTTLVPVGTTRDLEFVADTPGDWLLHCHMTHHMMNQMGHDTPNLVGLRTAGVDERVRALLPGYMTMGATGMGAMGEHAMPAPENSIPMRGLQGPFGFSDLGGMVTMVKVREKLENGADPGWYAHPAGTVARAATPDELRDNGIEAG